MPESILIVDDEDIIRESLTFILAKEGYRVREAPNGRAALDIIREDGIDLVLTKPFLLETLRTAMTRVLEPAASMR